MGQERRRRRRVSPACPDQAPQVCLCLADSMCNIRRSRGECGWARWRGIAATVAPAARGPKWQAPAARLGLHNPHPSTTLSPAIASSQPGSPEPCRSSRPPRGPRVVTRAARRASRCSAPSPARPSSTSGFNGLANAAKKPNYHNEDDFVSSNHRCCAERRWAGDPGLGEPGAGRMRAHGSHRGRAAATTAARACAPLSAQLPGPARAVLHS